MTVPADERARRTPQRLGLASGFLAYVRGAAFVVGTPRLWPWAAVPVVVLLVLLTSFATGGIFAVHHALAGTVAEATGFFARAGAWFLEGALAVAVLAVAALLALALTQPLSGFALERIGAAQERALGAAPHPAPKALTAMALTARITLATIVVATVAIAALTLVSVVLPPAALVTVPLKLAVSAFAVAWDLLDYPLGARGLGVRARLAWVRRNFGAFVGFSAAAGATVLVPGLGLLLLPWGVAGAARLATLADDTPRAKL